MNGIIYCLFTIVVMNGFFTAVHGSLVVLPELLSGIVFMLILLKAALEKTILVSNKYLLLCVMALIHIIIGLVINDVAPGTILTGSRPYLKWIPFFLLPMVFRISEESMKKQLKFLLFLALLQCPIALYQRMFKFEGTLTGDYITGTLGSGGSGVLTLFMLSGIAMTLSFFVSGKIRLPAYIMLTLMLFIPTAINETKVTIFLLPIALFVPVFYGMKDRANLRKMSGIFILGSAVIVGFVSIYDTYYGRGDVVEFLIDRGADYLYSGTEFKEDELLAQKSLGGQVTIQQQKIGSKESGGRLDTILLPIKTLADDPVKLWIGVGIGNASTSIISVFSGEFSSVIGNIAGTTLLSYLLWETGLSGAIAFIVFLVFILNDSRKLVLKGGFLRIFAAGWIAVVSIILVAMAYNNLFYSNAIIFIFAYISGFAVTEAFAKRQSNVQTTIHY